MLQAHHIAPNQSCPGLTRASVRTWARDTRIKPTVVRFNSLDNIFLRAEWRASPHLTSPARGEGFKIKAAQLISPAPSTGEGRGGGDWLTTSKTESLKLRSTRRAVLHVGFSNAKIILTGQQRVKPGNDEICGTGVAAKTMDASCQN